MTFTGERKEPRVPKAGEVWEHRLKTRYRCCGPASNTDAYVMRSVASDHRYTIPRTDFDPAAGAWTLVSEAPQAEATDAMMTGI